MGRSSDERPGVLREELRELMFEHFGVYRNGPTMERGLERLNELKARMSEAGVDYQGRVFNQALVGFLEVESTFEIAEVVALGAIAREESRGSHYRTDFPDRVDGTWLVHTMAYREDDGPRLEYEPPALGHFEVKERVY
jgi:succinate dehydrogenase / fumarate reductase flavoprotein subunit